MNQTAGIVLSLLLPIIIMIVVTVIVSSRIRRAPATSAWKATREGVLFVVSLRRWQRVLIRTVGIIAIVIGCILFLAAVTSTDDGSHLAMGIAGSATAVVGIIVVWLAHGMARLRLEVAPDRVFAFPLAGAPREVALSEVTDLAALRSSNYGGVAVLAGGKRLFYATRIMLGYPQLIEYFQARRPDLVIPDASWPLQASAS